MAQSLAKVGALVPDHEFSPLVGHEGLTRLSELRGHPVIIAGIKQHMHKGLDAAWVAKELGRKYAKDGLVIILEDQRAWTKPEHPVRIQAFWMKFFEAKAWFTSHLEATSKDVPVFRARSKRNESSLILICVDGKLVLEGTAEKPSAADKKSDYRVAFKRAVATELRRKKKGWGETAQVRKFRAAAYGKENLAAAWKALDAARSSMDRADWASLREELDHILACRKKALRFLFDQGRLREAKKILGLLKKSVRGVMSFESELAGMVKELESEEVRAGLKLDPKLSTILKRVTERKYAKFGFEGIARVRAFAKKHEGSSVGARAARMDPLLKHLVAFTKGIIITKMEDQIQKASDKLRKK